MKSIRSSIVMRMFLILITAILIPVLTLFFTNRANIQQNTIRQSSETYHMLNQHVASYLSDKIKTVKSVTNMLSGDTLIQEQTLLQTLRMGTYECSWTLESAGYRKIAYTGYLINGISRVYLYISGHMATFENSGAYLNLDASHRQRFDEWKADPSRTSIWLTRSDTDAMRSSQYIYYVTKVPNSKRLGMTNGLMQADISLSSLQSILMEATVNDKMSFFLLDGNGEIFLRADDEGITDEMVFSAIAAQVDSGAPGTMAETRIGGARYLSELTAVDNSDWKLLLLMPYSEVISVTQSANRALLITLLILLLLLVPLIYVIALAFTRRIRVLNASVDAVANGNYSIRTQPGGSDEIGHVIRSFNQMLQRIQEMMHAQYMLGQALKNTELQVLQEQINPHFLYNTLDLLHWQARIAGATEIDSVVNDLSHFYKLSLGSGDEIVSIEHELQHVSAYTRIQNVRFSNRINLVLNVDDALRSCRIVKIVLQPLVENSIQHGIREKEDESGTVTISVHQHGGDQIVLSVADDGIGMDAERLAAILDDAEPHTGYGVHNVNERLILHYGQSASLRYESHLGKGTRVTMRIPKIEQ